MDEKERREGTGKTVHLRGKDKKDMVFARCKARVKNIVGAYQLRWTLEHMKRATRKGSYSVKTTQRNSMKQHTLEQQFLEEVSQQRIKHDTEEALNMFYLCARHLHVAPSHDDLYFENEQNMLVLTKMDIRDYIVLENAIFNFLKEEYDYAKKQTMEHLAWREALRTGNTQKPSDFEVEPNIFDIGTKEGMVEENSLGYAGSNLFISYELFADEMSEHPSYPSLEMLKNIVLGKVQRYKPIKRDKDDVQRRIMHNNTSVSTIVYIKDEEKLYEKTSVTTDVNSLIVRNHDVYDKILQKRQEREDVTDK